MREHDCELVLNDEKEYRLCIRGREEVCSESQDTQPRCCRVTIDSTTVVPPAVEVIIRGKVQGTGPAQGLLEGTPKFLNKALLARSLVDASKEYVPLRILNPGDQPLTLFQDTVAAWCEPAEVITERERVYMRVATCSLAESTSSVQTKTRVPSYLHDLERRSGEYLTQSQRAQVADLLEEYSDIFAASPDDLGQTDLVTHKIPTGDAAPIRQPPRRIPLGQREEVHREVQNMLEKGVIEPSESPWQSPVVLVKKKDGSTRFCLDYRKLNEVTTKDAYPLPRIDDCLEALGGSKWFSTLDLASGYWQVMLDKDDREKTAFSAAGGLYQFTTMPFGLCNAPATFERLIEKVLAGLPWEVCLAYLDDLIVHAESFELEMQRLRDVFDRLRAAKLKLSPKKCHLFQKKVTFLGHVVDAEGISTDPEKIATVRDWPVPRSVKELRSFLGLASYYRRFIDSFAQICRPLYRLTETGRCFRWNEDCDEAFARLKRALTTAPVLALPIPDGQFILDTDASDDGIGAVLSQVVQGEERVVAYFSRTITKAERRYCVTRKELLAVVAAVRRFHYFLFGQKFVVRTDHNALRWLLTFKDPEGQLARWLETLTTYDFVIEYRRGVDHGNADSLSRRPCLKDDCRKCSVTERKDCDSQSVHRTEHCHIAQVLPEDQTERLHDGSNAADDRLDATTIPANLEEALSNVSCFQQQDPVLKEFLDIFTGNAERPEWCQISARSPALKSFWAQWDRMVVRDGILYRRFESDSGDQIFWQVVVPVSLRKMVLKELHNSKSAGHLGEKKTLARLRERFYWLGCGRDVRLWCQSCDECASRKPPAKSSRAPMQRYNVGAPLERIALDVLGPLPETDRGNKYILVVADYFTKWTESYALPDQVAPTVAAVLVDEFVSRFGVPLQIHSDQGRNFESAVFSEMCDILGVQKTRTTPLRPQSDGMVERFNRTLETMLTLFTAENQKDWDEHLPQLMMAYRSAEHETTGRSPCEMMLGRAIQLPVDLLLGSTPDFQEVLPSTDYATQLASKMRITHDFARGHLDLNSRRHKRSYDHRLHHKPYTRGDAVWLHNKQRKKGKSPKLSRSWDGPYLILKKISDMVYRIQKSSKSKPKVVHYDRLKPYHGSSAPSWLKDPPLSSAPRDPQPTSQPGSTGTTAKEGVAPYEAVLHQSTRPLRRSGRKTSPPLWSKDYELN